MHKRKRLTARAYREWHTRQAKKHKSPITGETGHERRDTMLHSSNNNLEASCLREGDCSSETCPSQSQQQRIDSDVKSQPCIGEAAVERDGSSVPEGCEQASSSTNVQLHKLTSGDMIEGGNFDSKEVHSVNHEKTLSHVETGYVGTNEDEMEGESNCSVHNSEELSICRPSSLRFTEYWVPAGFSHLQLEKYCETLIRNSLFLCSTLKKEIVDALHDVLTTIKKCCDHPYLVDQSLERFVNEGRPTSDLLSTGIEASGKLLLLDKFLKEVQEKQLRVLIVFQSNHSNLQLIHLRHVLDDFIRQRFGEESYVHIYKEFDHTKKRAALDLFNDKKNGKFVILIEKSSCQASIKLTSVDLVILFNSDWSPINDMRSLRKMSIQSECGHLKVFRFYSINTVEEKLLMLAKEGTVLESSLSNFSYNVSHMLLLWGTPYLFNKLDDFHSDCSSIANLNSVSEQKLVFDVVHELSALLSCQDSNTIRCSLISKVPKVPEANEDYFANISLYGEQDASYRDDDIPQYAIWISLLEPRNPQWKLLPGSPQKMRRRGKILNDLCHNCECKAKRHSAICKKALHSRGQSSCPNPRSKKLHSPAPGRKAGKVAGDPNSDGNEVDQLSCGNYNVEEICNRRMKELILKQKKEVREFYRTKREERAKLEEEHRLELDLIHQRYIETSVELEEIKKLDSVFQEKFEAHNHEMDVKRKELEDIQRASRINEKRFKDRLHALSTMKNSREAISLLVDPPLLDSELGLHTVDLIKSPICTPSVISNATQLSESQHSKGIDQGLTDGSSRHGDPGLPPDQLTETGNLSVESGGENDAASVPRAALSINADHNDVILVSENGAPQSAFLCEKHSQDLQHTLTRQIEGDGSTNMEPSKESLQGSVSRSLESDGENDVMILVSREEHDISTELVDDLSKLGTSNENKLLSGQKNMETLSDLQNREVKDADDPPVGTPNGDIKSRGADLETRSTVAEQQCEKNLIDLPSSGLARSSNVVQPQTCTNSVNSSSFEESVTDLAQSDSDFGVCPNISPPGAVSKSLEVNGENNLQVMTSGEAPGTSIEPLNNALCTLNEPQQCVLSAGNCSEPLSTLPNREVHDREYNMEPLPGDCNGKPEGRGAADMGNTSDVATQQHIENVTEVSPSRSAMTNCVSLQPQTYTTTCNSSPSEQPMMSADLPCNQMRQTAGMMAVSNCQTPGIHTLCQPEQVHVPPLVDLGLHDLPVVQPIAIVSSPLQSGFGHGQPHISSVGGTTMSQPASSYLQETSYLRANIPPSPDPLHNELVRMQKEEEEAIKIYEDKVMHLKSAYQKEVEDIRKKYDLLIQEAENMLQLKKEDVGSRYMKVSASKLLAETLQCLFRMPASAMSLEALFNAMNQVYTPHQTSEQRIMPSAEPASAAPVQVVHQLAELINPVRPQSGSALLYATENPLAGYQTRALAPLLHSTGPTISMPMSNALVPSYGMSNQQILEFLHGYLPRPRQPNYPPGFGVQLEGTQENPVLL